MVPAELAAAAARLAAGQPLDQTDRAALMSTTDLLALGVLAEARRRHWHGDRITFVRVARVGASARSLMSIPDTAGEIRIDGPIEDLAAAGRTIERVLQEAPERPVSAFTVAELESWAAAHGAPLEEVLDRLRATGLELVGELELDQAAHPIEVCRLIDRAGLRLARVTVRDSGSDIVRLTGTLQAVQASLAAAGRLPAFAPLPRRAGPVPSTGYEDVRRVALARLLLDDWPTIQVDWTVYGPKLAQVALAFGADDLDGVPCEAGSEGWRRSPIEEVRRNIAAAGCVPVERNARFDFLDRPPTNSEPRIPNPDREPTTENEKRTE